ncbi:MAG: ParB/RepB/Spo0J family partition protein [Clostridia bacterium]|nr:ParB/RepB/Spo0J family partition protein [Clostridia bacterium]
MAKKGGLNRSNGFDELFLDNSAFDNANSAVTLGINEIEPNRDQPRRVFDEKALEELSKSIEQNGIIQPLLVRPMLDGSYQLVAGERRWRAARMAGLTEVPVTIREMTDEEASVFALIENLQREDLNPVEEAQGLKSLIETYGFTQEETADRVGKSRVAVTNTLRLLKLPASVLKLLNDGKLTAGHSRALLSLDDEKEMLKIAEAAISQELSVRQVEKMVKYALQGEKPTPKKREKKRDKFYDEVEIALTNTLGRKVKVYLSNSGHKGTLEFEFFGKEDLTKLAKDIYKE